MAIFMNSSSIKVYLVEENLDHFPIARTLFTISTILVGMFIVCRISQLFLRLWTEGKRSPIMTMLYLVYFINILIHTARYSDNMVRPEKYFELKWFYRKYIISSMELKFLVNILLMIFGYNIIKRLINSMVTGERYQLNKYSLYFLIYIFGSILAFSCYLIEGPDGYELIPNLLISGESVSGCLLLIILIRIYYLNSKDMFGGPEKDLAKLLSYQNNSDDEEVITYNKVVIETQRIK